MRESMCSARNPLDILFDDEAKNRENWTGRAYDVNNILATLEEVKLDDTPSKPKVTLTQDEVSRITYFDIDSLNVRSQCKRTLKRVRDQFVLACFFNVD